MATMVIGNANPGPQSLGFTVLRELIAYALIMNFTGFFGVFYESGADPG